MHPRHRLFATCAAVFLLFGAAPAAALTDTTLPDTTITSGPSGAVGPSQVVFDFSSSEADSTFQCRFDGWSRWHSCTSPAIHPNLDGGARTFFVRAVDPDGNVDPMPAQRGFTVATSVAGYPSPTRVDANRGFDPGCQLLGGNGGWQQNESGTDYPGRTTIEHDFVAQGSCAARFFGRAGVRTRAELQARIRSASPQITYEFLTYIPGGAGYPSKGTTLTQTKNPRNPATGRGCYGGGVSFGNHGHDKFSPDGLTLTTVSQCTSRQQDGQRNFQLVRHAPLGRWFAVKVHERFADNGRGFVEAWYDDDGTGPHPYTLALPRTYGDNLPISSEPYVKIRQGSYRPATNHDTWIYGDGFRLTCERC